MSLFTSQESRGVPTIFGWPGQSSNPVGYTAVPGYSGFLTAWPGGGFTNGTTYSFYDFSAGSGTTAISGDSLTFIGCRFQSNAVASFNVNSSATNTKFINCSFTPLASIITSPPYASWPSSSAGLQKVGNGTGYQIDGNSGYQYGLNLSSTSGPTLIDHCDIWGFGNAINFTNSTSLITINSCWIHDAADAAAQGYHTDGPGYLNAGTPPANILITNNTIASIGNTNALAFQGASSNFDKINIIGNYISGFGYAAFLFETGVTNSAFTDNTFGTDLPWVFGPLHGNYTSQYTGNTNTWRRNRLKVLPGTSPNAGATLAFTSADDGKFILPGTTLSTSDFTG